MVYVFGTAGQSVHFWQAMGSFHTGGTWCYLPDPPLNTVTETCKVCEDLQRVGEIPSFIACEQKEVIFMKIC